MRKNTFKKKPSVRDGDEEAIELLSKGGEVMEVAMKTGLSFERVKALKMRMND
jgi:hypothetical protein